MPTITDDMIERACRAMWGLDNSERLHSIACKWDDLRNDAPSKMDYRRYARAALEAALKGE